MVIRLVATDLDGTLLDGNTRVSERTAKAVAAAQRAGIMVVPVTGRPPHATWALAAAAGLRPLGVCSNGAVVVDLVTEKVIEVESIVAELSRSLVDLLRREVPGILLAADHLDGFVHEPGFFDEDPGWDENVRVIQDLTEHLTQGCVKLVVRIPGASGVEMMRAVQSFLASDVQLTTSGLDWVEIGAAGITKAYALERVCNRLGVTRDEVIAIGDHHNDLAVLAWAGQAMAPANAVYEVLAVADRILPANTEDGVAVLLEELAEEA
jgi:Cof subfamily protein (haloacid dehalogenase superfamily)